MQKTLHPVHGAAETDVSVSVDITQRLNYFSDFTTKLNIVSEMLLVMGVKLITPLNMFRLLQFVLTEIMQNVCFVVGVFNYILGIIPVITNYVLKV